MTAEAVALRDEKIALLNEQLATSRQALDELKAAGTADQQQIKVLKEEISLLNKEVKTLKATNWLTGRLSMLMIFAAAAVGYLLGQR